MSNTTELLLKQAIQAAINQDWPQAISLNLEILETAPNDVGCLNRLGNAYVQAGDLSKATQTYKKVLTIDAYNPIATRTLTRLTKQKTSSAPSKPVTNGKFHTSFIEEPGKTKTVTLVRPSHGSLSSHLSVGHEVKLSVKKRRVSVETMSGEYLGCLPDDVALRIMTLLEAGYLYDVYIRSLTDKAIVVFIRELSRSTKANNQASFPSSYHGIVSANNQYNPLEDMPVDVTPTGEEDEFGAE